MYQFIKKDLRQRVEKTVYNQKNSHKSLFLNK